MKIPMKRPLSRPGFARAAFNYLIAAALPLSLTGALSAQTLLHRYSFASDASDSVGGANGTIVAPGAGSAATITNGLILPGGGGGGFSGYVALPGGLLTATTNLTVEVWATQNAANTWATIWDFANDGSHNFELCPHPGNNNGLMESAFTPHGNEQDLQSAVSYPNGSEQYVAETYNNATLTGNLYYNGAQVATLTLPDATYRPGRALAGPGDTAQNWLRGTTLTVMRSFKAPSMSSGSGTAPFPNGISQPASWSAQVS